MKKRVGLGVVTICAALLLTGCGGGETSGSQSGSTDVNLKVWVDPGSGEFYKDVVNDYKEANNIDYTIEVIESDTGKAQEYVKKDPDAAADVFSMPHDQLGQLVDAGVIYENTKYADEVTENNTEQAVNGATYQDKLYGYPYGVESMMLYYDKSKLTEEDVKTYEGMVAREKIGLNFEENGADYFAVPFFVSNGSKLYGEDGEDPAGTTFNDAKGVNVLKWIAAQGENPNVVQANADLMSQLENGSIAALVSGPWGKENVEEILGDNMGIATYPTNDFGDGTVQMKAFLGVKLYSVNANTKHPLEAMELANYLSSQEAQKRAYDEKDTTPSNTELQQSDAVINDPLASTVVKMADPELSVLMPKIPEMVSFWPGALSVISDGYKGKIPEDQIEDKLTQLVEDTATTQD
ncbi:extracellular solute-binding protein [Enterococcus sp. AZ109]|uniref:extracellular solute-binding protein n=1 Tax=Enterococcus sp. AZ109 TaxID=2774634 RepID=UPI003F27C67D